MQKFLLKDVGMINSAMDLSVSNVFAKYEPYKIQLGKRLSLFDYEPYNFETKRDLLLKSIRSPSGKTKYKRHVLSPLRYAGGKSLAVGLIAELLPVNIKKIVSPFFGGGSVEIACSKDLGLDVIGYDIFDILVNYWNVQIKHPEELFNELKKIEPTRKAFDIVKDILKKHWNKEELITDPIKLAAIYYFNHNTSYGPHFLGHPSSVYLQKERYETILNRVRNFRPGNLDVKLLSFEKAIEKHSSDFLYCDPPYYLDGDSKTFVGMYPHRNFPIHHKGFKHELLRDLLLNHKGGFILSYNDCSVIRKWYKGFNMTSPKWQYTFSQGDTRIGKNRIENNNGSYIKQSHELLIWKMPEEK
jgi:DNA adenine methylase